MTCYFYTTKKIPLDKLRAEQDKYVKQCCYQRYIKANKGEFMSKTTRMYLLTFSFFFIRELFFNIDVIFANNFPLHSSFCSYKTLSCNKKRKLEGKQHISRSNQEEYNLITFYNRNL